MCGLALRRRGLRDKYPRCFVNQDDGSLLDRRVTRGIDEDCRVKTQPKPYPRQNSFVQLLAIFKSVRVVPCKYYVTYSLSGGNWIRIIHEFEGLKASKWEPNPSTV